MCIRDRVELLFVAYHQNNIFYGYHTDNLIFSLVYQQIFAVVFLFEDVYKRQPHGAVCISLMGDSLDQISYHVAVYDTITGNLIKGCLLYTSKPR